MGNLWARGLSVPVLPAPREAEIAERITEEAALTAELSDDLRIDPLVAEGAMVAQGAPLFRLHRQPEIVVTAPMAARVARLDLAPGRRLRDITLFREKGEGRHRHALPGDLRATLLASGLWTAFRSRPFGRHPAPGEIPAAIFVMAADTRPGAPDPRLALAGRAEAFARGMAALATLTERLILCQSPGDPLVDPSDRLTVLTLPGLHPHGLPGMQIHRHFPARPEARTWDIAAEEVAALGTLLETGHLPETRLVTVTGTALREGATFRCQPWADLRALSRGLVRPGPHRHVSGSVLDGREARWLRPRDRQVSVMPPASRDDDRHWFLSALRGARRPLPLIPTAALEQALGGDIPTMPLLRALSTGDAEAAIRLGALSLLPEDLTLADYVTCSEPRLSRLLAGLLARIEAEEAA